MRQVPYVCCRAVIHAATATQARITVVITVLPSWLDDSTCSVLRAIAVTRGVAPGLTAVAPAALVAPSYMHCKLAASVGVS